MKITLDLTSVVVGGGAAVVLGLVAGFSPQATQLPSQQQAQPSPRYGQAWPKAEDIVVLTSRGQDWNDLGFFYVSGTGRDSQLFTVPTGKRLVVSSFTRAVGNQGVCRIEIDGVPLEQEWPSSRDFGVGLLVLDEGQTLRLCKLTRSTPGATGGAPNGSIYPGGFANLHCYLEDA